MITAIAAIANEIDLVDGFLDHLIAHGVDSIIVTDICSFDGTRERLVERSTNDDRIRVLLSPTEDRGEWDWVAAMVAAAREAGTSHMLQLDADERLLILDGTLLDFATDAVVAFPRFNMILPRPGRVPEPLAPETTIVAVNAPPIDAAAWATGQPLSWVVTRVAGRILTPLHPGLVMAAGGHDVTFPGDDGLRTVSVGRPAGAIVHMPVTTRERFHRKAANVQRLAPALVRRHGAAAGLHWQRIARLVDEGPAALDAEFDAQFKDGLGYDGRAYAGAQVGTADRLLAMMTTREPLVTGGP
jgi:hypothetical protein